MRRFSAACLLTVVFSFSSLRAQDAAYKADPKFINAMAEGKKMMRTHQFPFAMDAYKKASKVAGGKDAECLQALFDAQMSYQSYKDALKTVASLDELASTPKAKFTIAVDRGTAFWRMAGDKGKPEDLHAADDAFKAAIAIDPKSGTAHYLDGRVLAKLGEMEPAQRQFKECVSCMSPKDPSYTRIQHFAANPSLATAKMASAFVVTALDGTKFNLDEMGGRVVLIDFWATWCGPCNAELPHMKKIAQEFAGQPLVIISVSWDADETKWKEFIAKNGMNWVQYRDADHNLSSLFDINSIPHYFTIDADGVLTAEMMGSGSDVEGKLKKLVAKAKAANAVPIQTAAN